MRAHSAEVGADETPRRSCVAIRKVEKARKNEAYREAAAKGYWHPFPRPRGDSPFAEGHIRDTA